MTTIEQEGLQARTNRKLLAAAKAGSTDAAEQLIRLHWAEVHSTATFIVGDMHLGEDLAQEALMKALHNLHRFDEERHELGPWLRRVIVNHCIDWLRSPLARDRTQASEDLAVTLDHQHVQLASDSSDPELALALQKLEPDDRALLVLRHVLGYSNGEAAEVLDITATAASSRQHRAMTRLREGLRPKKETIDG